VANDVEDERDDGEYHEHDPEQAHRFLLLYLGTVTVTVDGGVGVVWPL
jgi:hypothetical protein